jgi:formylmethanofuran dehydrogenase subunit B
MTVYTDVVCPFCGCLCDDLEITVEGNEVTGTKGTCAISRSKFMSHAENKIEAPTVDGKKATTKKAVEAAAKVLAEAKRPLVYGLSSTECEAIARCVELAEIMGGVVDNTSSVCHGPTILALQQVGESKTTLGEVKNRADLIVFWGCNPTAAHLRHLIRYSGMPKGMYTPEGRKNRYIVAVDVRETNMARVANEFIKVTPNGDFELLLALRATVQGVKIKEDVSGVKADEIKELAKRMKGAKMGIVFFGLGLTQSDGRHMNIDAAVGLVAELQRGRSQHRDHLADWIPLCRRLRQGLPEVQPGGVHGRRHVRQGGARRDSGCGLRPGGHIPGGLCSTPGQGAHHHSGPEGDPHHDDEQGGDTRCHRRDRG